MPRSACGAGSASATGCGRSSSRSCSERGARWSSVPLGSPGCVDGPFLEGGDTLLNGYEIYVGISGCASDLAGVDWLQALLGETLPGDPGGDEVERAASRLRLALIKPGLLVWCPPKLIDGLPMSLRDWDKIEVSVDEANRLATNGLILEEGRVIVDADNGRVIEELRKRKIDVIPCRSMARSAAAAACAAPIIRCCAKACSPRRPLLGVRSKTTGLGRFSAFLRWTPGCARPSPPGRRRSAAAPRRSAAAASRRGG